MTAREFTRDDFVEDPFDGGVFICPAVDHHEHCPCGEEGRVHGLVSRLGMMVYLTRSQ